MVVLAGGSIRTWASGHGDGSSVQDMGTVHLSLFLNLQVAIARSSQRMGDVLARCYC